MTKADGHRIVSLSIENVKRLKAIKITPAGDLVVIGGENDQGKSSVLDSITMALAGGRELPPVPLRNGTKKGVIKIETGKHTIERTFTEKGSKLEVRGADGAKFDSPQKLLDSLYGELAFDPLAFTRMQPREQYEALRKLVGIDFTHLDKEKDAALAERRRLKEEAKTFEVGIMQMPEHTDAPAVEVSAADIITELRDATASNAQIESVRKWVTDENHALLTLKDRIVSAKETLKSMEDEFGARLTAWRETKGESDTDELADTTAISDRLAGIEQTNKRVRANLARKAMLTKQEACEAAIGPLTEKIDAIDATKRQMVEEAKFPVAGLGFSEEGVVTIDGVPFEQAAKNRQIRISAAMGMALQPELRVMLIHDGSLLGERAMAELAAMAHERDYQIWVERVSTGKEVTVIIEDGSVRVPEPATAG